MRLALYQPDIPQNTGAILRLAACLGVQVDIVEPCGFLLDDRRMRRAGMDYLEHADYRRHRSWPAYLDWRARAESGRLLLLTTAGARAYTDFTFAADDTLLLGRESAGVPKEVHALADATLRVPMRTGLRSLNVALAAAIVLGEALRQTDGFPPETPPSLELGS
ncbi:MAG: tRNA (cytidine(34)-2'-O)-methyltransferase [Rhodovibrionaceae bacterium]|nr:tRNA (cytidine(34)-2'-O)-methyltransferase [Rhodovibrionaceae bacterium]